ncbi:hypothetical protein HD554DRAFT_2035270 [Boletus coccyginus]|nr:hypothetical protein HD554DRAFT_2035270 [Boletus coccyginus]
MREAEEASKEVPASSWIFSEMIVVTSKLKPVLRPGKATAKLYGQEIDAFLSSTFLRNRLIGSLAASSHEVIQAAASRVFTREDTSPTPGPNPIAEIAAMITKYFVGLGDKILAMSGLSATSFRIGQIARDVAFADEEPEASDVIPPPVDPIHRVGGKTGKTRGAYERGRC